jgi:hypothetical protein
MGMRPRGASPAYNQALTDSYRQRFVTVKSQNVQVDFHMLSNFGDKTLSLVIYAV